MPRSALGEHGGSYQPDMDPGKKDSFGVNPEKIDQLRWTRHGQSRTQV